MQYCKNVYLTMSTKSLRLSNLKVMDHNFQYRHDTILKIVTVMNNKTQIDALKFKLSIFYFLFLLENILNRFKLNLI